MTRESSPATITINGVAVSQGEFQEKVDGSLSKISTLTEKISEVEKRIEDAVKDAKVLTGEHVDDYKGNVSNIADAAPVERRRIWSLGIKVIDDEKSFDKLKTVLQETASVLKEVAGAQYDADKVLKDVLTYQKDLAHEMQFLLGIGAVSLDQCQWVAKSVTLRIHRAAQGELNDAEVQCLNHVLADLETQSRQFHAMGNLGSRIQNNKDDIQKIQELGERHSQDLERQRKKDVEHDKELSRQREVDLKHDQQLADLNKRVSLLETKKLPIWIKVVLIAQTLAIMVLITLIAIR